MPQRLTGGGRLQPELRWAAMSKSKMDGRAAMRHGRPGSDYRRYRQAIDPVQRARDACDALDRCAVTDLHADTWPPERHAALWAATVDLMLATHNLEATRQAYLDRTNDQVVLARVETSWLIAVGDIG